MASNAEELREMYRRFWNEGDANAGRELMADDIVWVGLSGAPLDGSGVGRRVVADFFSEWLEAWEDYSNDVEVQELSPDVFVTHSRFRGRGKGSGIEFETELGQVWQFRDGKIVRQEMYRTYDEACRAADLLLQRDGS